MHKNLVVLLACVLALAGCGGGGGGCGACSTPGTGGSTETGGAGTGGSTETGGAGTGGSDSAGGLLPGDEEWAGAPLEQLGADFAELAQMYKKSELEKLLKPRAAADLAAASKAFSTEGWPSAGENSLDKFNALFFPAGWNEEASRAQVIAAIIDSGLDASVPLAPGFDGHYSYDSANWLSLSQRLDLAAHEDESKRGEGYLRKISYDENITYEDQGGELVVQDHGSNVAHLISQQLPNARFVNIVANLGNVDKNHQVVRVDETATIDAVSSKGVRFFNRSVASDLDLAMENPANYYPATMHYDALFLSAASNELADGHFTQNTLLPSSPMRRGWIVVSGFGPISEAQSNFKHDGQKYWRSEEYFIEVGGQKVSIYPWGNSCKEVGAADCISAPFFASPSEGEVGMGTSYATPLVTAVAMSVYAKYPWMSNVNIKQTLFSTAYKVHAAQPQFERYVKNYFGAGAINPTAAMRGPAEFGEGGFDADVDEGLYVFANKISGAGGLNKRGEGTLVLSEENSFSGAVNVSAGELWLLGKNAAPVSNSARLRMASGSAVGALQNAGLLVSEGFSAASLELLPSSRLAVNLGQVIEVAGEAKLDGKLGIIGAVKKYLPKNEPHSEEILRAGAVSGEFGEISSQSAFIKPTGVNYGEQAVSVQLEATNATALPALGQYAAANYERVFEAFEAAQAKKNAASAASADEAAYAAAVKQGLENVQDGAGYKRDDGKYPLCGGLNSPRLGQCADDRNWPGGEAAPSESRVGAAMGDGRLQAVPQASGGLLASTSGEVTPKQNPLFSQKPGENPAPSENPLFSQKPGENPAPSENPVFVQKPGENPAPKQNPLLTDKAMRTAVWLQNLDEKQAKAANDWLFGAQLIDKYASEFAITRALMQAAFAAEKTEISQLNFLAKSPGASAYLSGAMMSYAASLAPGASAVGYAALAKQNGGDGYALFGAALSAGLGDFARAKAGAAYLYGQNSRALGANLSAQVMAPLPFWRVGVGLDARYLRQDFAASNTLAAHINKSRFEQASVAAMLLAQAKIAGVSADFGIGAQLANASEHEFSGEFMGARLLNGGKIAPKASAVAKIGAQWQLGRWHIGARAGAEFARGGYASGFLGLGARFLF